MHHATWKLGCQDFKNIFLDVWRKSALKKAVAKYLYLVTQIKLWKKNTKLVNARPFKAQMSWD